MADPIARGTVTLKDDKSYTRKLFTVWKNDNGMVNFNFSKEDNEYDITLATFLKMGGLGSAKDSKFFHNFRENTPRAEAPQTSSAKVDF